MMFEREKITICKATLWNCISPRSIESPCQVNRACTSGDAKQTHRRVDRPDYPPPHVAPSTIRQILLTFVSHVPSSDSNLRSWVWIPDPSLAVL